MCDIFNINRSVRF